MWEADKSCEAYKRVYTCYSIVLFVSSSTLQLWAWKISTEAATIVPSAGNCHSKCHLCRGRGFELLRKQGKPFRTTHWSPSSSRSRVTCTARILAAFVKHFQDRPYGVLQEYIIAPWKLLVVASKAVFFVFSCSYAHASNVKCNFDHVSIFSGSVRWIFFFLSFHK